LKGYIEDLRNDQDKKIELGNLLYEQMDKINAKNKQSKHNQMHHMSHGSSNYSQGSGGGSGGGYSGHGKQPQKGYGAYEDQYIVDQKKNKKNNSK